MIDQCIGKVRGGVAGLLQVIGQTERQFWVGSVQKQGNGATFNPPTTRTGLFQTGFLDGRSVYYFSRNWYYIVDILLILNVVLVLDLLSIITRNYIDLLS